jgi:hypothetical protein
MLSAVPAVAIEEAIHGVPRMRILEIALAAATPVLIIGTDLFPA